MKPHSTAQGIIRWHSGHKHACTPPRLHGARLFQCRQRTAHGMPVRPEARCQLSLGWQFVALALAASGYFGSQRGGNRCPDRGAGHLLERVHVHCAGLDAIDLSGSLDNPTASQSNPDQMTARPDTAARKAWMGPLGRARPERLVAVVPDLPGHDLLHAPKLGQLWCRAGWPAPANPLICAR